ncbi:MAG: VIT1/CCC1 transporter family protein [Candidatus Kariarchaeaceae archaeon]|jgi:VIT1/CCC1 family predicted Fe2+/Mn2+ transporter
MSRKELKDIEDQKSKIELKGQTRDFVFGIQDGLISILGLLSGVYGAYGDDSTLVVVIGITGAIAAALSMAAGSLLSAEAERDLLLAEINKSKKQFLEQPYLAQESLLKELEETGLDKADSFKVVQLLSNHEESLFKSFQNTVLGLPAIEEVNPYQNAIVMFLAFILGSLFPIIPFIVMDGQTAFISAILSTSLALFTVGAIKGKLSEGSVLKSGMKFFVIAVSAAIISELMGSMIGVLI